ncbi:hypothetical protein AB0M29_05405 [Streptomyces sp. NPDC051976]
MSVAAPPWDIGRPRPALLALAESGALRGRVLDEIRGRRTSLTRL